MFRRHGHGFLVHPEKAHLPHASSQSISNRFSDLVIILVASDTHTHTHTQAYKQTRMQTHTVVIFKGTNNDTIGVIWVAECGMVALLKLYGAHFAPTSKC